jgi:DNA-binding GntR family transcriptional regulator
MRDGPPAVRYITLNQRFHTTLYEHSGRAQLVAMIAALRDASSAYLHIYRAQADFPVERLDAEHRAILAACLARDPEAAAEATREHLENTVEHVAARL